MGSIFVLFVYIFYFVGISILVGPNRIMELEDFGAKVFLIFIIILVLGTLNGFILGFLRMPYSLAIRDMFPMAKKTSYS